MAQRADSSDLDDNARPALSLAALSMSSLESDLELDMTGRAGSRSNSSSSSERSALDTRFGNDHVDGDMEIERDSEGRLRLSVMSAAPLSPDDDGNAPLTTDCGELDPFRSSIQDDDNDDDDSVHHDNTSDDDDDDDDDTLSRAGNDPGRRESSASDESAKSNRDHDTRLVSDVEASRPTIALAVASATSGAEPTSSESDSHSAGATSPSLLHQCDLSTAPAAALTVESIDVQHQQEQLEHAVSVREQRDDDAASPELRVCIADVLDAHALDAHQAVAAAKLDLPNAASRSTDADDDSVVIDSSAPMATRCSADAVSTNKHNTTRSLTTPEQPTPLSSTSVLLPPVAYSVRDVFPVVYEPQHDIASSQHRSKRHDKPSDDPTLLSLTSARAITTATAATQTTRLQPQRNATTPSARVRDIAATEKRTLQQRLVRTKQQLNTLTVELQRLVAANATLQAENDAFATKLPHVQHELQTEARTADERQTQVLQLQLALTQLRARAHVLETHSSNVDAKCAQLQNELRNCRQELQRKIAALAAATDRLAKVEADSSTARVMHAQQLQQMRAKLANATQHLERERTTLERALASEKQQALHDVKAQAAKVATRTREFDAARAMLERELAQSKQAAVASKHEADSYGKQAQRLAQQAQRVEAALRSELAARTAQLQTAKQQKQTAAKATAKAKAKTTVRNASTRPHHASTATASSIVRARRDNDKLLLLPLELLLQEIETADSEAARSSRMPSPLNKVRESLRVDDSDHTSSSSVPCASCKGLQSQLETARNDLERLRSLHAHELKAQAAAFAHVLQLAPSLHVPRGRAGAPA